MYIIYIVDDGCITVVFSFAFVNVLEVQSKCCIAFIPTTVLHTAHLLRLLSYSYAKPVVSPWSTVRFQDKKTIHNIIIYYTRISITLLKLHLRYFCQLMFVFFPQTAFLRIFRKMISAMLWNIMIKYIENYYTLDTRRSSCCRRHDILYSIIKKKKKHK